MIDSPAALLLLLAAFVAVPVALRRMRRATPDTVRVLARTALSRNTNVALIAVGGRRLLIGVGERGVQLLTELDPADVPGASMETTLGNDPHALSGLDGMDAAATSRTPHTSELLADLGGGQPGTLTAGPRIGLVDRLRSMTVRSTPDSGRPPRVPPDR